MLDRPELYYVRYLSSDGSSTGEIHHEKNMDSVFTNYKDLVMKLNLRKPLAFKPGFNVSSAKELKFHEQRGNSFIFSYTNSNGNYYVAVSYTQAQLDTYIENIKKKYYILELSARSCTEKVIHAFETKEELQNFEKSIFHSGNLDSDWRISSRTVVSESDDL